ncbi:MAG TPA: MoaD/ThiS family protein [Candidatus Saccharimonadales bacterium]|nr:MoaD/ThiS family protein [Candidatus Saccharimonadales bacterium]
MLIVNDRDRIEWRAGMTVQDVLDILRYDYVLMTVTVDGALVPEEEYSLRRLPDGARLAVFHLAHGG